MKYHAYIFFEVWNASETSALPGVKHVVWFELLEMWLKLSSFFDCVRDQFLAFHTTGVNRSCLVGAVTDERILVFRLYKVDLSLYCA
jgi:hypothetical protein